jgi:alpha-tubulin suppressor-like RCC1 family protein
LVGVCGNGTCNGQGGCTCEDGWEGPDCREDIDECVTATPCLNGGQCTDIDGSFSCACATGYGGEICNECADGYQDNDNNDVCCRVGYTGTNCNQCDTDSGYADVNGNCQRTCSSSPKDCGDNGMCDDAGGDTVCVCDATYYGEQCDSLMGTCTADICGAHGECAMSSSNTFKCDCEPGYVGRNCETVDECALAVANGEIPCKNDGVCVDGNNAYTCMCDTGWTGADCSQVQACEVAVAMNATPCNGQGACVDGTGSNDSVYTCTCSSGWTGTNCGEMDYCFGNTCQNGSTCVNGASAYTCSCVGDYEGQFCQSIIDNCIGNQCQNGGACVDGVNTYTCDCTGLDYTGDRCQTQTDDCVAHQCLNGGVCVDGNNTYTCDCAGLDYTGNRCQTKIDDCVAHQCLNGGACVDGDNTYTCDCAGLDYNGNRCQTKIDDCALNPCSNGGLCADGNRAYTCDCAGTGYSGTTCQDDLDECLQAGICGTGTCANVPSGGGYTCQCPDGSLDVGNDGTNCSHVASLSAGSLNTCAITAAGSLHCWGDNAYSQLGQGAEGNTANTVLRTPKRIGTGTNWTKVSVGNGHACGIRSGRLFCWGNNLHRQCGVTGASMERTPVEVRPDLTWTDVSAGDKHTCALAGTALYCWGNTATLQAGTATTSVTIAMTSVPVVDVPTAVAGTWSKVSAGGDHTCAINGANELRCWGSNSVGQLTAASQPIPVPVGNSATWEAVDAGPAHTCAVAGTQTYCWGEGSKGSLGNGASSDSSSPQPVSLAQTLNLLATGNDFSCGSVNTSDGFQIYCWGTNDSALLLTGGGDVNVPTLVTTNSSPLWVAYAVGANHMCGVIGGLVYCWGNNSDGAVGSTAPNTPLVTTPSGVKSPVYTHSGSDACDPNPCRNGGTCTETPTGYTCDCTNTDYSGPNCTAENNECTENPTICGQGTCRDLYDDDGYSCTCPAGLIDVDETGTKCEQAAVVSIGSNHTCVITEDSRTLHCWGSNRHGGLGLGVTGTTTYYPNENSQTYRTPLRLRNLPGGITNAANWTHLAVGEFHTCGIVGGSSLYCWGNNTDAQISGIRSPLNVPANYPSPVLLDSSRTWVALATGYAHNCAIDSLGEMYCWGKNSVGQLGRGTTSAYQLFSEATAVAHPVDETWVSLSLGGNTSCGLTSSNSVYCWGQGNSSQIGNMTNVATPTPARVTRSLPQGFTFLEAGINVNCALVGTSAYCWGSGGSGAIGDGGGVTRNVPTAVSGGLAFSSLTGGSNFNCGLVAVPATTPQAYTAHCWGTNFNNMLLTGGGNALVPAPVTSREWELLEVGASHMCGVDHATGYLYCWGSNGEENGAGQGKVGSVPAKQIGNIGLVGPVRAATVNHAAP